VLDGRRSLHLQEWTLKQTATAFVTAVYAFHVHRSANVGSAVFAKEDALTVTLVAAASNLRSLCFGIPVQSEFAAKGMAGNIIHAIATTNAIIAGYIVIEALRVLNGFSADCRSSFLSGVRSFSSSLLGGCSCQILVVQNHHRVELGQC
jgi:hypothetical protein